METEYKSLGTIQEDYTSSNSLDMERSELVRKALPVRDELKGHLVDSAP